MINIKEGNYIGSKIFGVLSISCSALCFYKVFKGYGIQPSKGETGFVAVNRKMFIDPKFATPSQKVSLISLGAISLILGLIFLIFGINSEQ